MDSKGIVLAGGSGTRLYPMTRGVCKQLLPVYNKPLVYYPLSVLMLAGVRDVLIISTPDDLPRFEALFGDGTWLGMRIAYLPQPRPDGIGEAFIIGEDFIAGHPVSLILGDNIFFGDKLSRQLRRARPIDGNATIFGYAVQDPKNYGVLEFNADNQVISITEKPEVPASNYAVTGLYFYNGDVTEIARSLKPSPRGELEITDINMAYLEQGRLGVELLGRGISWFDTGSPDSLLDAANFVATIERRQGLKIACLEEIAWRNGWIDDAALREIAAHTGNQEFNRYLLSLLRQKRTDAPDIGFAHTDEAG